MYIFTLVLIIWTVYFIFGYSNTSPVEILEGYAYTNDMCLCITKQLIKNNPVINVLDFECDYIIVVYYYKNKVYKLLCSDNYDFKNIDAKSKIRTIKNIAIQEKDTNIDVNYKLIPYAGPNHDFHELNYNFKHLFPEIKDFKHKYLIIKYDNTDVKIIEFDNGTDVSTEDDAVVL